MTKSTRITTALINRTEEKELLEYMLTTLTAKAWNMFNFSRDTMSMWENPAFNSLETRINILAEKLETGCTFGDYIS